MNEMKADGSCHCAEEEGEDENDDEEIYEDQPDPVEEWISAQSGGYTQLDERKVHSECSLQRQAVAFSMFGWHLTFYSGTESRPPASSSPRHQAESENPEDSLISQDTKPNQDNPLPGTLQKYPALSISSTSSSASEPDTTVFIPRTTQCIPQLLRLHGLFPHWTEDELEEWTPVCERYRDKTHASLAKRYQYPFTASEFNQQSSANPTGASDQQYAPPGVGYRQKNDVARDTDNVEDETEQ